MSSGSGLSNLGIALTVVFIIALFALLAQLFYVLLRRRSLLCQIPTTTTASGGDDTISKEQLLYFFCMRTSNLSRVEPSSLPSRSPAPNGLDQEVIDMLKVQSMYGPSRVLCTIKEEEREGVESADERPAEKEKKSDEVGVVVVEDEDDGQFSTPCASPPFLTPSGSLTKDDFTTSLPVSGTDITRNDKGSST